MNRLVTAFKEWFASASRMRRAGVLLAAPLLLFAVLLTARLIFPPPDWQPLYPELSERAGGEVLAALERLDLPARVDPASGRLEVPARQLHLARMKLAAQGLPRDETAATLPAPRLGVSSRMEQAQLQDALERSLAASIASLPPVREARVHLTLVKASPFLRDTPPSSAAVLLRLHPGMPLSAAQADTIRTLVAAAVPRLPADAVRVLDAGTPVAVLAPPARPASSGSKSDVALRWILGLLAGIALIYAGVRLRRKTPAPEPDLNARLARLRHETLANPALAAEVIRQWLR